MNPKEQAKLQVLNSLRDEHMTLDQAAALMGITTRQTRRILAGLPGGGSRRRGSRPPGPQATQRHARCRGGHVIRLARTKCEGANHTHLSELLSEREGIDIVRTTLRRILVTPVTVSVHDYARVESITPQPSKFCYYLSASCSVERPGFWEPPDLIGLLVVVVGLTILHISSPTSDGSIPEDKVTTPVQANPDRGTMEVIMQLAISHVVNRVLRAIEDAGAITAAGVLSARPNNLPTAFAVYTAPAPRMLSG